MTFDDLLAAPPAGRRKTVVVPFANDPDGLRCIGQALQRGLAEFVLIGDPDRIRRVAAEQGAAIARAELVDERDEQGACERAVALIRGGHGQALMKGLVQSATFLRAILDKTRGVIDRGHLISGVAVFQIPAYHKLLLVTDPGVNISPSLDAKIGILRNAVALAGRLGIARPKVACVSAVEKANPAMPGTLDAQRLAELGREGAFGDALVEGPFGFDVAISRQAASVKGLGGQVPGDPDIVLLPDIVAANVLYKTLVWLAGATGASVVVGARVPIVLTSRSDAERSKLASVALAVRVAP